MRQHYKRVVITAEFLLDFITTGRKFGDGEILECVEGIPPGCEIIDIYGDPYFPRCIVLTLQHESFAPVKEWEQPPVFNPTMTRSVVRRE